MVLVQRIKHQQIYLYREVRLMRMQLYEQWCEISVQQMQMDEIPIHIHLVHEHDQQVMLALH
jgi:hypothetical protein